MYLVYLRKLASQAQLDQLIVSMPPGMPALLHSSASARGRKKFLQSVGRLSHHILVKSFLFLTSITVLTMINSLPDLIQSCTKSESILVYQYQLCLKQYGTAMTLQVVECKIKGTTLSVMVGTTAGNVL